MVSDKQRRDSAPPTVPSSLLSDKTKYFLAEVTFFILFFIFLECVKDVNALANGELQAMHAFEASSDKELDLAVGDYVVVRKVDFFF